MLNFKIKNIFILFTNFILFLLFISVSYIYSINVKTIYFKTNNININKVLNVLYSIMILTLLLICFLNKKIVITNKWLTLVYLLFCIILFFLVFSNSILVFFLAYEFLLLLTAIVVYYYSPNIRSKIITFYFIIWTQFSSFLLWLGICYIYFKTKTFNINSLNTLIFDSNDLTFLKVLIFTSFAVKLPLWPFSFWLIKTHVEANTSFSIFLSGVLVKTALIGLIKFNFLFNNQNSILLIYFILLSTIFCTFNLNYQVDFKKLIAYTTIQEMSVISIFIHFNSFLNTQILIYFIILHTILSFILFFLNDIIYIRFKTRKTNLNLGIMTKTPKLSMLVIITWWFFVSVPLTLKFFFELLFLFKVLSLNYIIIISLIITLQYLSIIFFSKNIIPYLFGNGTKFSIDITKTELLLIFFLFCFLAIIIL